MAEQVAGGEREAIRAVVVYRYPVYRDLITRVLERAEVSVAGALGVKEMNQAALRALSPDVVVIYDPDANNLLRDVAASGVLDTPGSGVSRVVCVGSENEMVVLHRQVVPNPSVEGLLGWVMGVFPETRGLPCATVDRATGQKAVGSGGS